ncbi:ABC transporter permease [Actinomarinicola tropica]|uniref:ABC transporter permease subunit n=1 Tax=Actinomarinicola tropica TaxID=2789776 RepID=A0A5Q2RGH7_9ACTN|nr:ABC transporter permease [Actinomarinicola tropica]QGG93912.1 ABC transporter permease subunit [Actinomarinicola tropica]
MLTLIGRKLIGLVPVLLAASFLTFMLLSLLPGDPALQILGMSNPTPEQIEQVREELGLNDSLPVRYWNWLSDAATGDLGSSFQTRQTVTAAIGERLPVTAQLMVMSLSMAVVVSIPLGVAVAYKAGSLFDRGVTAVTFGLLSIPNFVLALFLIIVFAVELGWFPATGWTRLSDSVPDSLRGAFLPSLSLAIGNVAVLTRLLRTDMIATLQEDHVVMAKAKGLPTRQILFRHALRPSSFSLMTVLGLQVAALLSGTVIIEQIFALPGLGRLLLDRITNRDYIMVQGLVLFLATVYVFVNFAIDILYSFLDPRIRHGKSRATA